MLKENNLKCQEFYECISQKLVVFFVRIDVVWPTVARIGRQHDFYKGNKNNGCVTVYYIFRFDQLVLLSLYAAQFKQLIWASASLIETRIDSESVSIIERVQ